MIRVIIPNEEYSNIDDATKKALVGGAVAGATALGVALAQKQRQLSDVEKVCGKKPLIGKGKKQVWQDCANRVIPQKQSQVPISNEPSKKDNKMLYIIGGSIVGLGIVAFTIYKLKNK
jgi:hypothetical protein